MTTTVRGLDTFDKKLRTLAKKYPKVLETVETLVGDLENDQRPGDQVPGVGYPVYKVRLANLSANRGKSGGFRAIYFPCAWSKTSAFRRIASARKSGRIPCKIVSQRTCPTIARDRILCMTFNIIWCGSPNTVTRCYGARSPGSVAKI